MGYMGLSSWGESDSAADMTHGVMSAMAKSLKKALKDKGNQYNTDGITNVSLFYEGFLLPNKEEFAHYEGLINVAKETVTQMGYKIMEAEKADWGFDGEENKTMHLNAYKRMVKSLNEFVQAAPEWMTA